MKTKCNRPIYKFRLCRSTNLSHNRRKTHFVMRRVSGTARAGHARHRLSLSLRLSLLSLGLLAVARAAGRHIGPSSKPPAVGTFDPQPGRRRRPHTCAPWLTPPPWPAIRYYPPSGPVGIAVSRLNEISCLNV